VVKLDLRGPLREPITRLNSVANLTPAAISSCSMPIAFSLARIWSPNPCTGLHSQFLETEDRYLEYPFDGIFFDEAPTDCNPSNPFLPTQFGTPFGWPTMGFTVQLFIVLPEPRRQCGSEKLKTSLPAESATYWMPSTM
jgi:hypothetical protein